MRLSGLFTDVLKQMVLTLQPEMISLLVPFLSQAHTAFQENNGENAWLFLNSSRPGKTNMSGPISNY